jgi:hypothetical protein
MPGINIFQFLKQGTSLSRHAHNNNQQLETDIIPPTRQTNHTYQLTGKFHDSDSEEDPEPDTYDQKQLEDHKRKKAQRAHEFAKRHAIKVEGLDHPLALSNFTKIIR